MPVEVRMRLSLFVSRILEWNARINLTGAKSRDELFGEHLVDSFAVVRFLPQASSVADIGSGGGLPGIPLAILRPDIRLTMIEPRAKRVAFLRAVSHELRLKELSIIRGRVEEACASLVDVCFSRATFPPEEWLEHGRGLVKPSGVVLVFANEFVSTSSGATLVDSQRYVTGSGRSRWMGAFRFT